MCTWNQTAEKFFLVLFFVVLCCYSAGAQRGSMRNHCAAGTIHSVKGVGFALDSFKEGHNNHFSAVLDLRGIISGESSTPGFKANYHREIKLTGFETASGHCVELFAGPGITAGYVRDKDPFRGPVAGISCIAGGRVFFGERFCISLDFQGDLALHIFKDHITDVLTMGLYKSGLDKAYWPQLTLDYCF